ncbi:MAG: hypothetical protein ACI8TX_002708 [Hyphomicrobiaceae bacterium]|jgi:hypothetical protein
MNNSQQRRSTLSEFSEQKLLDHFARVIAQGRHNTVQLLVAISEVDERKLWAKHACSSMFAFCMQRYHMSEAMTAKRIWAARVARRFPVVLGMLQRGELHLTAVHLLSKHLTESNHREVLCRAKHKSAREIQQFIAEITPRPDVPSRVRALPVFRGDVPGGRTLDTEISVANRRGFVLACGTAESRGRQIQVSPSTPARRQITALAPRRYKVEITVDQETHDKLRALEDLLSKQAAGDPAAIISRAINLLLADTLKKKAALRRAVWLRDVGRCRFEDDKAHRCRATRNLEYHHKIPFAQGGQHELANIELRCHGHNQYQADLDFERTFMQAKRGESYQQSARTVAGN